MNKPNFGVEKEIMLASLLKELETQMSDYNRLCRELDNVIKTGSDNDVVLNVLKRKFENTASNIKEINLKIKNIHKD